MMNVGLTTVVSTRSWRILQAKRDAALNHHLIDALSVCRRQPIEAAVERVMLGHRIAVRNR